MSTDPYPHREKAALGVNRRTRCQHVFLNQGYPDFVGPHSELLEARKQAR